MKPIVPSHGHEGAEFFEIGLGQEQYGVLPGYRDAAGLVLTEWEPNDDDMRNLLRGGKVRLWIQTGGAPLQPVSVETTP